MSLLVGVPSYLPATIKNEDSCDLVDPLLLGETWPLCRRPKLFHLFKISAKFRLDYLKGRNLARATGLMIFLGNLHYNRRLL